MNFDKNYFKSLNYVNYLEREDKYTKLANELITYLVKNYNLTQKSTILDYGAAIGFLTNAIHNMEHNCDAYDISEWASSESKIRYDINYINYSPKKYDFLIALDVFEHMKDENIYDCLKTFSPDKLIVRIPCSENSQNNFYLNISRQDPTHINCKNKEQWINFFKTFGYKIFEPINLYTIYDSKGVMSYYISI